MGAAGEGVEVMRKREVFEHPVEKWTEFVAACIGPQLFDELRLAALSPWWSYECASPGVGGCRAVVAADQMEAQVDPGCDAGGCEDVAVVDEEAVWQHGDFGVAALQLVGRSPVSGGGTSVEKPRSGEGEGSGADGDESGATRPSSTLPTSRPRSRRLARNRKLRSVPVSRV